ncbi:hypothetical protein F0562_007780 [Nyssa sinensis]|uniref:Bidirectional sugar transporter SWEET n=1 Tax=Nyssa sinensis TaxID=561372 RepID=A0A5J5A6M7_9ASTE|nr:hypothetical protein F0562_007780 [Nyssa sinensis]
MVSKDTARTLVGILGNITALMLFVSPLPTFIRIWKKGSVEQYSAAPYLGTLINCGLWGLYGLPMVHPHTLLIITINATGIVIELLYLLFFVMYSDPKKRLRVLLVLLSEFVFVAIVAFVLLHVVHSTQLRSTIAGSIGALGNIIMYASPLSVMKLVITTRSVEYMPLFLSLASFANGICWTCYAVIRFDPFIAAPNGLGTLFGLAQLILYATFYKATKQQMAATTHGNGKGEMGLAEMALQS